MNNITSRLKNIHQTIDNASTLYGRSIDDIQLLAVSKTRPTEDILTALQAGQDCFGESYLQEAIKKIQAITDTPVQWHFIGRIQSNKTRIIAENFDWVHSICSLKHAQRLNNQRPSNLPPLNICLQINLSNEESKAGLAPKEALNMVAKLQALPHLKLEGLMTLPAPTQTLEQQRQPFRALRELRDQLATPACPLKTLSMGMSGDLEAAIAEGATIIRVGTAIFGPRS